MISASRLPIAILLLLLLLLLCLSYAFAFEIGMRVLVLNSADTSSNDAIYEALESRGIPRDTLTLPYTGALPLLDNTGAPQYYAIVISDNGNNAGLTVTQQAQLDTYEGDWGVNEVRIRSRPSTATSTVLPSGVTSGSGSFQLAYTSYGVSNFGQPGAQKSTPLSQTAWRAPASITNTSATISVLDIQSTTGAYIGSGAAVTTYEGGTSRQHKRLSFFFDVGYWSVISNVYSHIWVPFVTRNIYFGQQRSYFAPHIDDVFLASWVYDPATNALDTNFAVRCNTSDWVSVVDWQTNLNQNVLPPNSDVRLEMWFNGYGGLGYEAPGVVNDQGALLWTVQAHLNEFFWGSHTWSHPSLDTISYSDAMSELGQNVQFAQTYLQGPRLQMNTMVTPMITGLFNAAALQAMMDTNPSIMSACGDSSVPDITNPYPYHGLWTDWFTYKNTKFFITPRAPTNIFYNTYLPDLDVAEYNYMEGRSIDFDTMLNEEAMDILESLARLDWREYMFHQANLIFYYRNGGRHCLVCEWVDTVVSHFLQYFDLPMVTIGQERLTQEYMAREQRDNCFAASSISATLVVSDDRSTVQGIKVTNRCGTSAYITVPKNTATSYASSEVYAADRTLFVPTGAKRASTPIPVSVVYQQGVPVAGGGGGSVTTAPATNTPAPTTVSTSSTPTSSSQSTSKSSVATSTQPSSSTTTVTSTQTSTQPSVSSKQTTASPLTTLTHSSSTQPTTSPSGSTNTSTTPARTLAHSSSASLCVASVFLMLSSALLMTMVV